MKKTVRVYSEYQHPTDKDLTWSGRGVKPRWLQQLIDMGHDVEEFCVRHDRADDSPLALKKLGYVYARYEDMVDAFGEPDRLTNDEPTMDFRWSLNRCRGVLINIHPKLPASSSGADTIKHVFEWEVESNDQSALTLIEEALSGSNNPSYYYRDGVISRLESIADHKKWLEERGYSVSRELPGVSVFTREGSRHRAFLVGLISDGVSSLVLVDDFNSEADFVRKITGFINLSIAGSLKDQVEIMQRTFAHNFNHFPDKRDSCPICDEYFESSFDWDDLDLSAFEDFPREL